MAVTADFDSEKRRRSRDRINYAFKTCKISKVCLTFSTSYLTFTLLNENRTVASVEQTLSFGSETSESSITQIWFEIFSLGILLWHGTETRLKSIGCGEELAGQIIGCTFNS